MPSLPTARLVLRPWSRGDEAALCQYANNWNVARNLPDSVPHPYTIDDAHRWIAANLPADGPVLVFAITLSGEPIGDIRLVPKADVYRCCAELGYWLGEPLWGHGFATEAVGAIVQYAFAALPDITTIQARHFAANPASGKVLRKCGFHLDGWLRQAAVKRGVVDDVLVYSLLRSEQAQKAAQHS
jgi:RimJ/RimL family protein N-acetyltransferase